MFTEAVPTMPLLKTDLLRTRLNLKNGKQKQTNNNEKNELRCKKVNRKYNTYKKFGAIPKIRLHGIFYRSISSKRILIFRLSSISGPVDTK